MTLSSFLPAVIAQSGEVVADPSNQRTVTLAVVGLVAAGVGLLAVTVWFWRSTRPDPEALAPLEEMSRRRFLQLPDDEARRRHLDAVRPTRPTFPAATEAEADLDPSAPLPRPEAPPAAPALPPPLGSSAARPIDPLLRPPPKVP